MTFSATHAFPTTLQSAAPDAAEAENFRVAPFLCALGIFVLFFLPPNVLDAFGLGFSNAKGNYLSKFHPATLLISFSFFVLLVSSGSPIGMLFRVWKERLFFMLMLAITMTLIVYTVLRSGPSGVSFLVYTHVDVPMAAVVLSYASRGFCAKYLRLFVGLAVLNAVVGIVEGIGHFRLMPYDPEWQVARDPDFRSSAFLGHPLTNAMFTAVMMPIVATLPMRPLLKAAALGLFLVALVPFGGRAAIAVGVLSTIPVGMFLIVRARKSLTFIRVLMIAGAVIMAPIVIGGGLVGLIHSSMGERLAAHSTVEDESAQNRYYSFQILNIITPAELMFGISADREADLINALGVDYPVSDIENPWLIMLVYLGAFMFTVWLAGTILFIAQLVRGQPFGFKIAAFNYFVIASLSDSFGRMDATYLFMVSMIVVASRVLPGDGARDPAEVRNYATWPARAVP